MPEGHDRRATATQLTLAAAELPAAFGLATTALTLAGLLADRCFFDRAGRTGLCLDSHQYAVAWPQVK